MPTSKNRLDPHIMSAFTSGVASGTLSADDRAWFDSRGPGDLVKQITVPTFLVEGTADTLFTLHEAITNYAIFKANGVPTKMMWFCGGHGVCLTGSGPAGHIEAAVIAWLQKYVMGKDVDTGPAFEWLADDAQWRSASDYPVHAGAPITASGSGTLALNPADAASGTIATAGRAANAVNVPVTVAPRRADPRRADAQSLTYSGTGVGTHVFAQLVDEAKNVVAGNQATPIPVTLDGQPHTVTRPLEAMALSAPAGAKYTLQIIGGTMLYGPGARRGGDQLLEDRACRCRCPRAASVQGGAGLLSPTRTCLLAAALQHHRARQVARR